MPQDELWLINAVTGEVDSSTHTDSLGQSYYVTFG